MRTDLFAVRVNCMIADFLLVANDNYVKYLGICTYSIMHNMCPAVEKVRIFVMDCGITKENKEKLIRQAARFDNAEFRFFNIEQKLNNIVPKVPNNWNRAIYGRLFLTEVLKEYDIKRLIYLDCDLLMERPVAELFTLSLDGKCIAGVPDTDGIHRRTALGISPDCTYINSGVLVIDTERWMKLDVSAKVIDCINSFPEKLVYPDQDAINLILSDEIKLLDLPYNMLWMICERDIAKIRNYSEDFFYTDEQSHRALYHANIYHFAGRDMWAYYGLTPVHEIIFTKYHKLCDWRNEKRYFGSLKNFMLWLMVSCKRLLIGEFRLTRQYLKEDIGG